MAKILIADDSPTIQKVIHMTLAGEAHRLHDIDSASKLSGIISEIQPDLLLLDYTLDETQDGYQIVEDLTKVFPGLKIIMMFGTFDTPDEERIRSLKISGKISKPFDGEKFINLCRRVLSGEENNYSETIVSEKRDLEIIDANEDLLNSNLEEGINDWSVDTPRSSQGDIKLEPLKSDFSGQSVEKLRHEMTSWSVEVPEIISSDELISLDASDFDFPAIIESADSVIESVVTDPTNFSINENDQGNSSRVEMLEAQDELGSLVRDHDVEKSRITDKINEEFEDLWKPDEEVHSSLIDEVLASQRLIQEQELQEEKVIISDDLIKERLEKIVAEELSHLVEKVLDEKIKQYVQEHLEKALWEIVPDLAENILTKEFKKISDQVLNSSTN